MVEDELRSLIEERWKCWWSGTCVRLWGGHQTEKVGNNFSIILISVRLPQQDTGAGGIDWGDSEAAPIEIEIVDAGTDCNYFSFFKSPLRLRHLMHAQLLLFSKDMCVIL